jgi:hypothetical protein
MHPSDNSVIKTIKCDLGHKTIGKSIVIKDNLTFGIRESSMSLSAEDVYREREEKEAMQKGCEFWCTLGDPTVRLFVENERDEDPKKAGASATITFEEGIIVKFLPTMEVLQSKTDVFRQQNFKILDLIEEPEDDSKVEIKRVIK